MLRRVTILGATGSIGKSTLDVIARHPGRFEAFALTANDKAHDLARLCLQFKPRFACLANVQAASELAGLLRSYGVSTEVIAGPEGLDYLASHPDVDSVMAAIVGAAGLKATLSAANSGKRILLANKEALVMAGPLFMSAVRENNATLLPIDSEHNAIFQCLPASAPGRLEALGVRRIVLTASGGPFRSRALSDLGAVTPDEACAHPNWTMGRKISVDSATMMNKALEVIEAHWLFGARADQISVVIHPQSVIHSMVEFADGSVIAQLGNPDMRTPIAQALAYPDRIESGVKSLDFSSVGALVFEKPDLARFPAVRLAYEVLGKGTSASAVFNAANEVAVSAFLSNRLPFLGITRVIEETLAEVPLTNATSLEDVVVADQLGRACAAAIVEGHVHWKAA
jgi:1-deoxy-D-xylulose-5-phosphate reductoisomerase